jgi:snRNA-activating protein complex subunit 3
MKRTTANRRIKEWQKIIDQTRDLPKPMHYMNKDAEQDDDDPFDCSDLIIRDTADIVRERLHHHLREWKDLDSRIVVQESAGGRTRRKKRPLYDADNDDNDNQEPNQDASEREDDTAIVEAPAAGDSGGATWGCNANRIGLPDFFDYKCEGPPPQPPQSNNGNNAQGDDDNNMNLQPKRRQVVSLEDPTQLLDYEVELWKIFNKIPIEEDIEKEARGGAICTNMIELNKEIETGLREYSRLDGHALSRARKKDRHHWPRIRFNNNTDTYDDDIDCAVIKFEFWRRHTKRFGSDPNKCEMEFLSTQTFQDVHDAIVDCTRDETFIKGSKTTPNRQSSSSPQSQVASSSGYFFIEDTFYSTGDTDYITPIFDWLNQDPWTKPNLKLNPTGKIQGRPRHIKCRKSYLKIRSDVPLHKKRMKDTLLGEIPMRLGIRYLHVSNGDVETSVFLSDISVRFKNENIQANEYPLLHDIWTTSTSSMVHGTAECVGCHHSHAVVVTIEDELADGGPTPFCQECFRLLHFDGEKNSSTNDEKLRYNNFKVVPISILENLRGLSVGHDYKEALFTT